MKRSGQQRLQIRPQPSQRLRLLVVGAHLLAALTLSTSLPSPLYAIPISLLLLLNLQRLWNSRIELHGRSECTITGEKNGEWTWREDGKDSPPLELQPCSFVTPYLVALRLRSHDGRIKRALLLLPDSIGSDLHRKVRARLSG